jgi:hypothetical protein
MQNQLLSSTTVDVPKFLAGFIYEMTGANHLHQIEACYSGEPTMDAAIKAGIDSIELGAWNSNVETILQFSKVIL